MPKCRKTIFNVAAATILNCRKLLFWWRKPCLHGILHPQYKFLVNRPNRFRDIAGERFSIWRPIAILSAEFHLFINWPSSEWKFTSTYQIWLKFDDWRLRYGDKTIFEMSAVRHVEFLKIAVLVTWPVYACDSTYAIQILHKSAKMAPKYWRKIFNMMFGRQHEFANFDFFCQMTILGMEILAYHIWSKSDDSRLRYEDKTIFKIVAVRHLDFRKLLLWLSDPVSSYDSTSPLQISHKLARIASTYIGKNCFHYGIQPPYWICKFLIFLSDVYHQNGNLHLHTKFDWNWLIQGWDMEIKLLSKWRPSAILNLRKLPFWSRDTYVCMQLLMSCPNFALIGQYGAKNNDFQYGVRPPSWICYDVILIRKLHFMFPTLC